MSTPYDTLTDGYEASGFYQLADIVSVVQNVHSTGLEASHLVKSGEGLLFGFQCYSNKAAAQFIQVFDNFVAPASGDVPAVVFTVGATSNLGVAWTPPRSFRAGCWIANSSTAATFTAGSADCFFDVQFL